MCDRTFDFQRILHEVASSGDAAILAKKGKPTVVPKSKSAFNESSADIARGVSKTAGLLTKLTSLVKKQGLFDDPTEEINGLIYRIKQDLDELSGKCDAAQQYIDSQKSYFSANNQASQHSSKVVTHLKSDLMSATKDFKTVLELRTSKMKDQQQKKVELTGKSMLSPYRGVSSAVSSDTPQHNSSALVNHRRYPNGTLPSPYATIDPESGLTRGNGGMEDPYSSNSNGQQQSTQQLLLEPLVANHQYYDAREMAVTEVEKTIGELGGLFKRLATMIAAQQEMVDQIDEDVETAVSSVDGARNALLKAYERVSSNRGLYMKLGAILAVFLLLFVLFMM